MAEPGQAESRGRWLIWGGGALVALLVLLAAVFLAVSRPPLSNQLIAAVLKGAGAGEAKVSGAYIGLGETLIAEVSAGADFKIETLKVDYGFPGILLGHVRSVRAETLKVGAQYEDGTFSLPVVGKLGGEKKQSAPSMLRLPTVEVENFSGSVAGLPIPISMSGKLDLVPMKTSGVYSFGFAGDSDFGTALPTEINATFDGAGNASFKLDAAEPGPVLPGRDALPAQRPGLLVNRISANVQIAKGAVQSAIVDLDVRSGRTGSVRFGEMQLRALVGRGTEPLSRLEISDLQLMPDAAKAWSSKLVSMWAPLRSQPALAAYASQFDAIEALPGKAGDVSAQFHIGLSASGGMQSVQVGIESLDIKTRESVVAGPAELDIHGFTDGPATIRAQLGERPSLNGHFALSLKGVGPTVEAGSVAVSATAAKGSQLTLTGVGVKALDVNWPSRDLTLEATADEVRYVPQSPNAITLAGATAKVDGELLDGIASRALSIDLSGTAKKSGAKWTLVPDNGCYEFGFDRLTLPPARLSNGNMRVCAIAETPIVTFDTSAASPLSLDAKLMSDSIFVDTGSTDSRVRIASLGTEALGNLGGAEPALHLWAIEARILDVAKSARFAPVDLAGAIDLEKGKVTGSLGASALDKLLLGAHLDHDLASKSGSLTFDSGELDFQRGGVQIQRLLPALAGLVTGAAGKVRVNGAMSWTAGRTPRSHGALALKGFGITTKLGRIEGIDGTVALNRLWPARTAKPQMLKVKTMDVGLPLVDGEVTFDLPEKFELDITKAIWPWANGHLAIVDGRFVPGEKIQHVAMTADAIDLTKVFQLLSIDGLSGTGIVDGRLPLEIRNGDASIVNGLLKARSGGVLKYTGESAAALAAKGEEVKLLFAALRNFHYQSLEIGVDGRVTGAVTVTLMLSGANPDVNKGHPMEINIKIDSELANLLIQTTQGLRIGKELQQTMPGGN